MEFNFEADEEYSLCLSNKARPTHASTAPSPFAAYSDDELLSLPADFIAQQLRETSLGGKEYVTGDTCASNTGAVRIPDIDATKEDYRPRLDWSNYNDVPMDPPGKFMVNLTLANNAIAPRIAEPSLPPSTKVSGHALTDAEVPLAPIQKALLKGAQTIQIVKKAGGDYKELAVLLGRVWGSDGVYDPDEELDLIGDVSLPRVLARSGKRRFETYRNIGFTSIVTAGSTHASNKSYGESAIINWQRRTELAKLFLHMAVCLESDGLAIGAEFGITVRIPFESVKHHTWSDLAISCEPDRYPHVLQNNRIASEAYEFVHSGLRHALRIVSAAVRARGEEVSWGSTDVVTAFMYDKLIFRGELSSSVDPFAPSWEIAREKRPEPSEDVQAASNAHDVRTAVIEMLTHSRHENVQTSHTFSYLSHLGRLVTAHGVNDRVNLVRYAVAQCPILMQFATYVASRPLTYSTRHRKANWEKIATDQLPELLYNDGHIYSAKVICRGLVYAHLFDHTSQVHRTVEHRAAQLAAELSDGIRSKKMIVVHYGESVIGAVREEILASTRVFYRERYRRRALACRSVRRYITNGDTRRDLELQTAFEYARADAAGRVTIAIRGEAATAILPDKRFKAVASIWASHLTKLGFPVVSGFAQMTVKGIIDLMQDLYLRTFGKRGAGTTPNDFMGAVNRFVTQHSRDYLFGDDDEKDPTHRPVSPVAPGAASVDVFSSLGTGGGNRGVGRNIIDNMMSGWFLVSGISQEWDDETMEELIEWVTEHAGEFVDDVPNYVKTHSKTHHASQARDLIMDWSERMDGAMYDADGANEIC